ncbi:MAG TPA: tetratricopeptide repeat protein [Longimicrobiaceae bacterium]|nr:tetratricopeptide repeat protein [Longimicrobiaceae bacterium]
MPYRRIARTLAAAALLMAAAAPLRAQDPLARGIALFNQRQWAPARRAMQPYAASHPRDARAAYYIGRTYLSERTMDPAVEWLEKSVALNGRVADYHVSLANAYGLQAMNANLLGQAILARKARGEFDAAVALDPANLDAHRGLMRYYMLAPALLGGSTDRARQEAEEIRRRSPWEGAEAFAELHRQAGDLAAATREYEALVRSYPDSVGAYVRLARSYEQMKRPQSSVEVFERLLRRQPRSYPAYYQIGRLGAVSGQGLDRAEELLQRYVRHVPTGGEAPLTYAHWRLGMVYEKQGKRDLARAAYRSAVALDPRNREAQAALARLGG